MLAKYYRFHVFNNTDQTIAYDTDGRITISLIPWKLTSGALVYGAEITGATTIVFDAGKSVTAAAAFEGVVLDNSANLYLGLKGTIEVTADVNSTDGTVVLYMEESTDNTVWPSDQADYDVEEDLRIVAILNLSTDAADEDRATNFEI